MTLLCGDRYMPHLNTKWTAQHIAKQVLANKLCFAQHTVLCLGRFPVHNFVSSPRRIFLSKEAWMCGGCFELHSCIAVCHYLVHMIFTEGPANFALQSILRTVVSVAGGTAARFNFFLSHILKESNTANRVVLRLQVICSLRLLRV